MLSGIGRKKRIRGLLSEHADSLITGEDRSADILADHPDEAPQLEGLFKLANRLATTATPVEPSPDFVENLKGKLYQLQILENERRAAWDSRREQAMKVSRVLGLIISIIAIVALLARFASAIIRLVAFLTARRRKTPATA